MREEGLQERVSRTLNPNKRENERPNKNALKHKMRSDSLRLSGPLIREVA